MKTGSATTTQPPRTYDTPDFGQALSREPIVRVMQHTYEHCDIEDALCEKAYSGRSVAMNFSTA